MIDETLRQLIEFFKTASPIVWETLMKQVYVDAISDLIWGAGLLGLGAFLARFGKYCHEKKEEYGSYSDWEFGVAAGYAGMAISILVAFILLTGAIQRLINPEFYVIRYILQQIK